MKLRHLHLPGLSQYLSASRLQEKLVRQHLDYKAAPSQVARPSPVVITTQFLPTYTCGRREVGSVSAEQEEFLRAGGKASFHEALRGGQTTFHGPGQLVAYPIVDLKRHGLSPKCYVHMLEEVIIDTCGQYGISARRTENPGVWVDEMRKICAVGVHLRRNITSHGIGLNINTDLWWFDRIVACGLEGKRAVSFASSGVQDVSWETVAEVFVEKLSHKLRGVDGISQTQLKEDSMEHLISND